MASHCYQVVLFLLTHRKDAARMFIAQPGAHTVQWSTADDTLGQSFLEIHEVPQ